ncbi:two-component system, OmpR family, phosphate regulon response regulator PhoB [Mucilaginibacter pineti]|uniref:Two-component system, OmpR family, phosphate regulon response regulator PhoB n=1 Tax=Mucilaginibacter pineti TaxID=1391627 RepID=A0A1G7BPF7_9SPHI|nr:response regulator [Mucilaginibacter pineti]SDE28833.1 two-component system, OmpR family, phosphate regulon response regulator PhoB [Mucilaginibacter pineti]
MRRILAVDDDSDILEVLQYILEDSGYEVETLSDGRNLFDTIKTHQPDLILLDIMLGGIDGRELCQKLKAHKETHDIPVILISASHDISKSLHQTGAPDDFIAKPFDIDVLLRSISRQLNHAA